MLFKRICERKYIKGFYGLRAVIIYSLLFCSCASKPGFKGTGDLCGLVVDEKNQPVKDFIIYCKPFDKTLAVIPSVVTNESGLFVFYDLPSGDYYLYGNKTNFLRISDVAYHFYDRTRIICLQSKSYKAALVQAEELIRLGQIKDAEIILEGISCENESREEQLLRLYQFFVKEKDEDKKKIVSDLKNNGRVYSDFLNSYTLKLEEVIK